MEEEKYYKQIMSTEKIGILDWDLTLDTILISKIFCKLLGYQKTNVGMSKFCVSELIPQKDQTEIHEVIELLRSEHNSDFSLQHVMIQKNGLHCMVQHNGTISYGELGKPIRLVSSIVKIAELKCYDNSNFENKIDYKTYFTQAPFGIFVFDSEGKYVEVNHAGCEMLGYSESELLNMNIKDVVNPEFTEQSSRNFSRLIENEKMQYTENCVTKTGESINLSVNSLKINDNKYLSFCQDISHALRTEKFLIESEEKFKSITENIFDAIYVVNRDLILEYISPSMELNYGYKSEDVIGKCSLDYIPKDDIESTKEAFKKIFQGNKLINDTAHIIRSDGSIADLEVTVVPIYKNNKIVGAQGMIRDVTEKNEALQSLRKTEIEYKHLFESAPVSIWNEDLSEIKSYIDLLKEQNVLDFKRYFDKNPNEVMKCISMLKVIDINKETIRLLKAQNKQEILNSLNKVFVLDSIETFKGELLSLIAGKKRFVSETKIMTLDDRTINVLITVSLDLLDKNWSNVYISIVDITDLKNVEIALQVSENKYRDLFNDSIAAIYLFDSHKNFIDSNQAGLDLLGYTRDELLKMSIPDVDADPIVVLDAHKNLLEGRNLINFEHNLKCKDGTIITVLNNSKSINDLDGNVVALQSTLFDITDRKRIEKALTESEEKFKTFANQTTEGIGVADLEGHYIYVNPAFCKMTGYSSEELLTMTVFDLRAMDENPGTFIKSRNGISIQVKLRRKDGSEFMTEIIGDEITLNNKFYILETVRDITERLISEQSLIESEKKYRTLFEVAQEGIWVIDADSKTTLVNNSMANMLGYSIDEMIGKHLFHFMDTEGIERAKNNIARRKNGIKEQHDFEFITKEGKKIITTIEAAPILGENKKYIGAIAGIIDITDRKKAETSLLYSKRQFDQILDRSNAVVYVKDLNHKYLYVNMKFKKLFIESMDNYIGKTDYEIFPKENADKFIINDKKVLLNKKHLRIQEEVFHDNKLHIYISEKFPLFDLNEKIYAICGISTDITELLETQEKEKYLQQQLVRKDRLIHVGQLASAIAHEINNPMTVLHGSLEEIKESKEAMNDDILEGMLRVSRRIKNTINSLLIFTRQTEHNYEKVDINLIIQNTFLLISNLLHKSSIVFTLDLSDSEQFVNVDQVRIQQVFINLIFNAMHAMKNGGILKVKSYKQDKNICISFEDNGVGIDKEIVKSIFLPFFTTKDVGEGTGLGLSIAHGIIEEHKGNISVSSQVNVGTTFLVSLPIYNQ